MAVVESSEVIISDAQDALDLMATIRYNHGCNKAVIDKENITADFFRLRTGLAGEIGNFDVYDSKSLRDFIFESNKGRQVFFVKDRQSALELLQSHRTTQQAIDSNAGSVNIRCLLHFRLTYPARVGHLALPVESLCVMVRVVNLIGRWTWPRADASVRFSPRAP